MQNNKILNTIALLTCLFHIFSAAYAQDDATVLCPNSCSGNGECVKGVCLCLTTHSGPDCSTEIVRQKYIFPSLEDVLPKDPVPSYRLKVLIVTTEFVGPVNNGGIGTAYTTLAHRLTAAGHQVTVLFTMGTVSQHGPFEDWVKKYAEQGIELVGLYRPPIKYLPRHMLESYEVVRFLRDRANFDLVHFHDYQGAGYYPMLAKQQGYPELQGMAMVIGLHGPNLWAKSVGNQETINQIGDLEMDYMERKSVEMADHVVSPSRYLLEWMSKEGWPVHNRSFVQPNLLPMPDRSKPEDYANRGPHGDLKEVRELVFFGRLETRKGVVMFCDAVEQLLRPQVQGLYGPAVSNLERITFLGRGAMVHGQFGVTYVQERAKSWSVPWKIISRLGPQEAKEYLQQGGVGRLAVMPSRIENSPYTVLECAEMGIPFMAAAVGGVADLVHPEDHASVLFEPTVDALVGRLVSALSKGVPVARPRFQADHNEQVWLQWHNWVKHQWEVKKESGEVKDFSVTSQKEDELPYVSVVMTHYNRPHLLKYAVESVERQDYPPSRFELVLIDDGSTQEDAQQALSDLQENFDSRGWTIIRSTNMYLGAARNKAVTFTKGEYVLFMDDDNYAKPHEISTFVRAMQSSGADVLTSFVDFFYGVDRPELTSDRPSYLFLGGSADVGAFKNCFGDANCFVRKSSFEAIGGYTTDYGVGFEDWEMYANASLRGFKVDIVPEAVYCYRFTQGSMQKTTNFVTNRQRSLRPYLDSLPESLHSVILNAVFPRREDGSITRPVGLAAEGGARFHGVDNIVDAQLSAQSVGQSTSTPSRHDEL